MGGLSLPAMPIDEHAKREEARLLELASDLMNKALARGADIAEVRARSGSELSAKVRLGEPELIEEASHRSVGMRVIKRKRVALISTSDLSSRGLARFIDDAIELVDISEEDPFAGPADPSLIHTGPLQDLDLYDPSGTAIDAGEATQRAKRAEDAARAVDPRISNSEGATLSRTVGSSALVLSGGFRAAQSGSYVSLSVVPVADDGDNKKRRGFYYSAKRHLADLEAIEFVGEEAARRTLRKLGARKVATCEAPVVFDPDAGRAILGLVAGCVLGGAIWRKSSYLVGREGSRVGSDLVHVVDDPLIARGPGSRSYDGEGLVSKQNVVIDGGRLVTYLCDSYAARKLGRASTHSASRGPGGGVGASTTNFILRPTSTPAKEIIQSTKRGLYVTDMMGFGFNAVTGDLSRGAAGFWIENGEITFPVSEVTISLNLDDLLNRIDMVGDDLDLRSSIATPTFRVSAMTIAGEDRAA